MTRKILTVLMLVVFMFSIVAVAAAQEGDEAMGVKLADLAGTTISFWHVWGTGAPSEGMLAVVDEFNATNEYGITVEAVDQAADEQIRRPSLGGIEECFSCQPHSRWLLEECLDNVALTGDRIPRHQILGKMG